MKKLILLTIAAMSLLTVSCKDEKKEEEVVKEEVEVPAKENFYVEIDSRAAKKDDFAVYFTEDLTNDFTGVSAVWSGIKANEQQKMVFDLPANTIPTNIRLDFGINKDQDSVVVSKITMYYKGASHEIKGSDFFTYFIKDEQFKTNIDPAKGTITVVKNGPEYKTPYYYPTQPMLDAVKKITLGE